MGADAHTLHARRGDPKATEMVDFTLSEEQANLLAMHEATQFTIADIAAGVEAPRLRRWKSATQLDQAAVAA